MTMPCSWDVIVPGDLCSGWDVHPQPVKDSALWLASTFLWAATGRQYGPCPVTVRPAQQKFEDPAYRDYSLRPGQVSEFGPYLFAGTWRNCGCGSGCCCQPECSVVLRGPVNAVDEVLVDGEVVPSSSYRVDVAGGAYRLVRLDGTCWPTCQDFRVGEDAAGAFAVTYEIGKELPEALVIATTILACEYAKKLTGGPCRLPGRMTSMVRQGVTLEVEPASPEEGLTGLTEVDAVVQALNPSKRRSPPLVLSLDLPEQCDRVTVVPAGAS